MIELNLAFLIQFINFIVLLFILNALLYKPLRKILAERRKAIADAKDKGESVDSLVQQKMEQYEAKLRDARNEASAKRGDALNSALAEESAILEKARGEASASLESIKSKVAAEAASAREALKQQSEAISGEICEKILGRSL